MSRIAKLSLAFMLPLITTVALAAGGVGNPCACVSLSVSKEVAPPGALAQLKVFITEPKPISTGGGSLTFDAYDSIFGISLSSHSQDSYGVAIVNGNNIKLSVVSPSATFGSTIDYPLLTVVGRVPPGTLAGTKFPLTLDSNSLQLYDTSGNQYPIEVKNGHLIAATSVSIGDVSPGSAVVPPGGVVTITGTNFVPGTKIKFAEANISKTQYVSPTEIDVTLSTTARMHGMMIKASNPDGTQSTYFSYQRVRPMPVLSTDPVMATAVPLQPPNLVTSATIAFPDPATAPGTTYGVALQNITGDTTATVDLLDPAGNAIATTTVVVLLNTFVVREFSELFGFSPTGESTIRVTSPVPIEVLGIAANQTTGTAMPILPR